MITDMVVPLLKNPIGSWRSASIFLKAVICTNDHDVRFYKMHTSVKMVVPKCVCFWLAWFVLYSLSLSDLWQSSCLGLPRDRTKVSHGGQLGIMGERRLARIN